jgi:hypothetical protein
VKDGDRNRGHPIGREMDFELDEKVATSPVDHINIMPCFLPSYLKFDPFENIGN